MSKGELQTMDQQYGRRRVAGVGGAVNDARQATLESHGPLTSNAPADVPTTPNSRPELDQPAPTRTTEDLNSTVSLDLTVRPQTREELEACLLGAGAACGHSAPAEPRAPAEGGVTAVEVAALRDIGPRLRPA